MIERFNHTLVTLISAYVDKDQRQWDINLPLLTAAYRSCLHEGTGFSPNMLMLGRETKAPIDLVFGPILHEQEENDQPRSECDYVADFAERMQRIYQLVREIWRRPESGKSRTMTREFHKIPTVLVIWSTTWTVQSRKAEVIN